MKKLGTALCGILLIIGLAKPQYAFGDSVKQQKVQSINLHQSEVMAEQSEKLQYIDKKIEVLERNYRNAVSKADAVKDRTSYIERDNLQLRKDEKLTWQRSLFDLDNEKQLKIDTLHSLRQDVKKEYLEITLLNADIFNTKQEMQYVDDQIRENKLKVCLGQSTSDVITSLENQRLQLEVNLSDLNRQRDNQLYSLKENINIPIEELIDIVPEAEKYTLFDDRDIGSRIEAVLKKDSEVIKVQKDLDLTKIEYDLVLSYTHVNRPPEADTLELSIKDKEAKVADTVRNRRLTLWTDYRNLKNLEDSVEIEKINFEQAKSNLETTAFHVKLGKVTEDTLVKDRLEYNKEDSKLKRAVNNYMIASESFQYELGEASDDNTNGLVVMRN